IPGCPIGTVKGSEPVIQVDAPAADTDLLQWRIPESGLSGPVIVRIAGGDLVELLGGAPVHGDGDGVWAVASFSEAVDAMPRTMDLSPSKFVTGPAFIVDAQLVQGGGRFCTLATPDPLHRIAEFACGVDGWLVPTDVADPTSILDRDPNGP